MSLATPTGTVTFTWFTNGTCNGHAGGDVVLVHPQRRGIADGTSFTQTPDTSGSFSFQADLLG